MDVEEVCERELKAKVKRAQKEATEETLRHFLRKSVKAATKMSFVEEEHYRTIGERFSAEKSYKSSTIKKLRVMELEEGELAIELGEDPLILKINAINVTPQATVEPGESAVQRLALIAFERVQWEDSLVGELRIMITQQRADKNLSEKVVLKILSDKLGIRGIRKESSHYKFSFGSSLKKEAPIDNYPSPCDPKGGRKVGLVFNKNGVYVGSVTSEKEKEEVARRASKEEKGYSR